MCVRERERNGGKIARTIPPNSINTLNGAEEKDESRARGAVRRRKGERRI